MMKQIWAVAVLFVILVNMVSSQDATDPSLCQFFSREQCSEPSINAQCPFTCRAAIVEEMATRLLPDPPLCQFFTRDQCSEPSIKAQCPNFCKAVFGAEPDTISITVEIPSGDELIAAVKAQDAGIVRDLIRKGADVNYIQYVDGYFNGWTPVMYASRTLSTPILKALIDAGADVNAKALSDSSTALHLAAQQPGNHTVIPLLEAGADASIVNDYSQTALHFASQQEDAVALNAILDYDFSTVNFTDEQGYAPIHYAAQLINPDGLNHLIDVWANVELKTAHGNTPLHLAARKAGGNPDSVEALLSVGAAVDEQDAHGGSALHYAAEQESAAIARALLKGGAKWNKKNTTGQTALHRAVEYGRREIIDLLATSCAAVTVEDVIGNTPIFYARHRKETHLANLLASKCKKT